jgi:hypothetical protein
MALNTIKHTPNPNNSNVHIYWCQSIIIRTIVRENCKVLFSTLSHTDHFSTIKMKPKWKFTMKWHVIKQCILCQCLIIYFMTYKCWTSQVQEHSILMLLFFSSHCSASLGPSYGGWIYNYICNQCISPLTLCDKVFQWLATGQWFYPGTLVSSTNKTGPHEITEADCFCMLQNCN